MGFSSNVGSDRALLGSLLQQLGLPIQLASLLMAHAEAVASAAHRLGLISPNDRGVVVPRHVADSLLFALARAPLQGERWVDVGSGAGFPGLILACCYPGAAFTLVEANSKKAGFLELQCGTLGLINTVIVAGRLEEVQGPYDVAVARAFKAPAAATAAIEHVVRPAGVIIVAAGDREAPPPGARLVRPAVPGAVDSPRRLFMIAKGA